MDRKKALLRGTVIYPQNLLLPNFISIYKPLCLSMLSNIYPKTNSLKQKFLFLMFLWKKGFSRALHPFCMEYQNDGSIYMEMALGLCSLSCKRNNVGLPS